MGKLRQDYGPLVAARPVPQLTGNLDGHAATPSPARALQEQLEFHATEPTSADTVVKRSRRPALAFMIAAATALWMALIIAGAQSSHAIV